MKPHLHILLATAAAAWIFPGQTMAADISTEFNAANKLYAEGKFADAAEPTEKSSNSRRFPRRSISITATPNSSPATSGARLPRIAKRRY